MRCNGCGGEFEQPAGLFCYGNVEEVSDLDAPQVRRENINASRFAKTLCPRCKHVLKDILLSSDLSDHWEKYDWSQMVDKYTESYDG